VEGGNLLKRQKVKRNRKVRKIKRVCRVATPSNKELASELLDEWVRGPEIRFCTKEGKLIKFRRKVV